MRAIENNLIYRDECYQIVGCCMEVHKLLGCGFKEAVYQEALEREFVDNDMDFEREKRLKIQYKGIPLKKEYSPDFVCFGKIVLELKAVSELTDIHQAQLFNYLKASKLRLGLLVNFGTTSLQFKRFVI
ncbi:MAG: GxxExxY protein [Bacteroidetes bacterium]|nr:GxxExxY protein [Bacteroidota bacterium]